MGEDAGKPLTLIHFGDLHVWRRGLDGDPYLKRWLGLLNLTVQRAGKFPASVADLVAERLAGENADCVLFSGDISTASLRAEFTAGRELLLPLMQKWGERFIAIPGNHDRYTPRAVRDGLFEKLFLQKPMDYPFARELGEGWSLVAFDCSVPRRVLSTGIVTGELIEKLRGLMAGERDKGRRLLVMGHYPILYPPEVKITKDHALTSPEREELLRTLKEFDARIYLHGHKHRRWALRSGDMLHLNSGSAGMIGGTPERSPGYLKIVITPGGDVSIEGHWLAEEGWKSRAIETREPGQLPLR